MENQNGTILSVKNLRTYFQTEDGVVKAVDGITFELGKGETLGIVGESGSGKSVTNLSIMRLIPEPPGKIVEGDIIFNGIDVRKLSIDEVRKIRGKRIAMIFQDPMTSLNPFLKISTQLMEVTQLHLGHNKQQARDHAIKMLKTVGIPEAENRIDSYPHEFSGGMRQRVMIAMALSCDPELLIADEPTTALDVTIQAQILDLLNVLRDTRKLAVLLITHDLGVVAEVADRVCVMYTGKIVEESPVGEIFEKPKMPYTQGLLRSVPKLTAKEIERASRLQTIEGTVPSPTNLPDGCHFAPRCEFCIEEVCTTGEIPLYKLENNVKVRCVLYDEQIIERKKSLAATAEK